MGTPIPTQDHTLTNESSPTATESYNVSVNNSSSNGLTGGAIAGIIAGVVVLVAIAVECIYYFVSRRDAENDSDQEAV